MENISDLRKMTGEQHYQLGLIEEERKNRMAALRHYELAAKKEYIASYEKLGVYAEEEHQYQESMRWYKKYYEVAASMQVLEKLQNVTSKQLGTVMQTINAIEAVTIHFDKNYHEKLLTIVQELKVLKGGQAKILDYCHNAKKYIDQQFSSHEKEVTSLLMEVNSYKNIVLKEYIKKLANLRSTKHEMILKTLNSASLSSLDVINRCYQGGFFKKLYDYFVKLMLDFEQYRKSYVPDLIDHRIIEKNDTDMVTIIKSKLDVKLHAVSFKWISFSYLKVSDLATCNIIDYVATDVDISVMAFSQKLENVVVDIRKEIFMIITKDINEVEQIFENQLSKKVEEEDRMVKEYIKNYEMLTSHINELLIDNKPLYE